MKTYRQKTTWAKTMLVVLSTAGFLGTILGCGMESGEIKTRADTLPTPISVKGIDFDVEKLTIFPRSFWDNQEIRPRCQAEHIPNKFTIHHTAGVANFGEPTPNLDRISGNIRLVQQIHAVNRGRCDIGYHFMVDEYGQIWQARYQNLIGQHVYYNDSDGNIGISFLGDYQNYHSPTNRQLANTAALIAWLASSYDLPVDTTTLFLHNQIESTSCPGKNLIARIGDIQALASELLEDPHQEILNHIFEKFQVLDPHQAKDGLWLMRAPNMGRMRGWTDSLELKESILPKIELCRNFPNAEQDCDLVANGKFVHGSTFIFSAPRGRYGLVGKAEPARFFWASETVLKGMNSCIIEPNQESFCPLVFPPKTLPFMSLTGTVSAINTNPYSIESLPGATIEIEGIGETKTDDNGNYQIDLPIGTYRVTFQAEGRIPRTRLCILEPQVFKKCSAGLRSS